MQLNHQSGQKFQVIPEESSRIQTQNQILPNSQSNSSFQLLLRAYERIRALQQQNEELNRQLNQVQGTITVNCQLQREVSRLNEELKEKEARIQNLQRISEKAIMDYVKIERELQMARQESCRIRKNLSVIPNQVNSPFHPTISNQQQSLSFGFIKAKSPKNSRSKDPKQIFAQKQRLVLNIKDENCEHRNGQFTFDGGNRNVMRTNNVITNCFSTAEMTNLVNKVQFRHDNTLKEQKSKIKQYKNYCSSMQKKYSPAASVKKQRVQTLKHLNFGKKFYGSPKHLQLRPSTAFNDKYCNTTHTTASMSGGFFNENR